LDQDSQPAGVRGGRTALGTGSGMVTPVLTQRVLWPRHFDAEMLRTQRVWPSPCSESSSASSGVSLGFGDGCWGAGSSVGGWLEWQQEPVFFPHEGQG
jgi:hypothetical protein